MFYVSVKLVSSTPHCSEFHSSKFADKAAIRYSQNEPLNIHGLAYNHMYTMSSRCLMTYKSTGQSYSYER